MFPKHSRRFFGVKVAVLIFLICIVFSTRGDGNETEDSFVAKSEKEIKYIIFDTDMGGDDAWALQMILKTEKQFENVKIVAITTVDGNTDIVNVIKNTYHILDGLNRTDIKIYKGASEGLIPIELRHNHFWGKNGFGDIDFWKPHYPGDIDSIIQKENAVEIIRDLVMRYPKQITLLCLGPLTNIALAIKTFPEIKENIKEIFTMGGGIKGRGNIVPTAEFNYYRDPESVYIVLNSMISRITILPVDVDENLNISLNWRFNTLGQASNHTNVQLLNEVEKYAFRNSVVFRSFDSFATAALLFPNTTIEAMKPCNIAMELQGRYTRGQTVVNHLSHVFNVNVIERISGTEYKRLMIWTAKYD